MVAAVPSTGLCARLARVLTDVQQRLLIHVEEVNSEIRTRLLQEPLLERIVVVLTSSRVIAYNIHM